MANLNIGNQVSSITGGFNLSSLGHIATYGFIALVVVIITGVIVYFLVNKKKYSEKITFWVRNPQTKQLTAETTIPAMIVRLDRFGNLVFRLKKKFKTINTLQNLKYPAKPHTYYVEYCNDGKIVEFQGINDYDELRKSMNATFKDDNTELGRSSMQVLNKERYTKSSWVKEHASLLVNIGAIVVIMVFLYLISDKLISLVGQLNGVLKGVSGLLDKMSTLQSSQSNILDSLNKILQTKI